MARLPSSAPSISPSRDPPSDRIAASLGQELTLANEIHDAAIDALQVEAQAAQSQVNRLLHHPLEGVFPLIVPLITAAISHLRKPAAAPE